MRPSMPLSDMSPEACKWGMEKLVWDVFLHFFGLLVPSSCAVVSWLFSPLEVVEVLPVPK